MSPTPCLATYQALQAMDKLRGSQNWASWKLLIMANARALRLVAHIQGSAQDQSPRMPRARETYAKAESCARILVLGSIEPELLSRLCELGLPDDASAADLMRWLHVMVSTREADSTAYDDLARLIRIDPQDFPSTDAYGKEALNLWARISHVWPGSANAIAATSILEGLKQHDEHAYRSWRGFVVSRKGSISQQDLFDLVAACRGRRGVEGAANEDAAAAPAGDGSSVYSQPGSRG